MYRRKLTDEEYMTFTTDPGDVANEDDDDNPIIKHTQVLPNEIIDNHVILYAPLKFIGVSKSTTALACQKFIFRLENDMCTERDFPKAIKSGILTYISLKHLQTPSFSLVRYLTFYLMAHQKHKPSLPLFKSIINTTQSKKNPCGSNELEAINDLGGIFVKEYLETLELEHIDRAFRGLFRETGWICRLPHGFTISDLKEFLCRSVIDKISYEERTFDNAAVCIFRILDVMHISHLLNLDQDIDNSPTVMRAYHSIGDNKILMEFGEKFAHAINDTLKSAKVSHSIRLDILSNYSGLHEEHLPHSENRHYRKVLNPEFIDCFKTECLKRVRSIYCQNERIRRE